MAALAQRLAAIFRRQRGLITRREALDEGVTPSMIARLVERREWEEVQRSVYKLAAVPDARELRALAAVLAAGDGAVLSHDSAAELWRLPHHRVRDGFDVLLPVKEETGRRHPRRVRGARMHTSKALPSEDVTVLRAIPVTSVPRTVRDIATRLDIDALEDVLVYIDRKYRIGAREMASCLERAPSDRGAARLLRAYSRIDAEAHKLESGEEARFYLDIARRLDPPPVINHSVRVGARRFRPDASWPDLLLGAEVDGPHHELPTQRRRDAARDAVLASVGWKIERIPYRELHDPERVRVRLQAAIDAARSRRAGTA